MMFALTSLPAQLFSVLALGLFVAYWLGYGAARWLLPRAWLPYRWLLMPAVGLTCFAVIAQPLALLGANTTVLIVTLFPLSLVANLTAIWKAPRAETRLPRRELVLPIAVALGAVVIGVLPFFAYGYLTVIGYNIDGSSYVAQAEFAKQYGLAVNQIRTIPSIYALTVVHILSVGVGSASSLWHSVISQLMGRDAFYSYSPILILWHGLSLLSVYLFYRLTFRLHFWTALLTTAALGLNVWLWLLPLDNYALHTFAMALLPVQFMATVRYVEKGERRALLLAALALGAQILTYPEATPFYVLPVLLYLALLVIREPRAAVTPIVRCVWIALLSLVVAPTAYLTLYTSTLHQLGTLSKGESGTVLNYFPLTEGVGLSAPWMLTSAGIASWESPAGTVWNGALWLVFALLLACTIFGFVHSMRTAHWFMTASGIAVVLFLAYMFFVQDYAYGFYKTWVTYLFLIFAFCGFGIQLWIELWRASTRWRRALFIPYAFVAFVLLLMFAGVVRLEKTLAERPPLVTRRLIQLSNSDLIPPGASIYLSLTRQTDARMAWAAYLLRDHPLFGSGNVGYTDLQNAQEGVQYDYALLNRAQNPIEFDYSPEALVWEDRWMILYHK